MTADLLAILDQLDEAWAAATPGPWKVCEDHGRDVADEAWSWVAVTTEMGREVATTWPVGHEQHDPEADAALIVAAVNAAPKLTAALRAVEALIDPENGMATGNGYDSTRLFSEQQIRAAIADALMPEATS